MQTKLEERNADIDVLTNRASDVSPGVRAEYNEQITLLMEKQAAARQKTDEMQKSGESAWQDLKSGLDLPSAPLEKLWIRPSPASSRPL